MVAMWPPHWPGIWRDQPVLAGPLRSQACESLLRSSPSIRPRSRLGGWGHLRRQLPARSPTCATDTRWATGEIGVGSVGSAQLMTRPTCCCSMIVRDRRRWSALAASRSMRPGIGLPTPSGERKRAKEACQAGSPVSGVESLVAAPLSRNDSLAAPVLSQSFSPGRAYSCPDPCGPINRPITK